MWGASFNDLAKKAAEMQEQAAASMATASPGAFSNMFNMDSLQNEQAAKNHPDHQREAREKMSMTGNGAPAQARSVQQPPSPKATTSGPQSSFLTNMTPTTMSAALSFGSPQSNSFQKPAAPPSKLTTPAKQRIGDKNNHTSVKPSRLQTPAKKVETKKTTGLVIGGKTNRPASRLPTKAPAKGLATPNRSKLATPKPVSPLHKSKEESSPLEEEAQSPPEESTSQLLPTVESPTRGDDNASAERESLNESTVERSNNLPSSSAPEETEVEEKVVESAVPPEIDAEENGEESVVPLKSKAEATILPNDTEQNDPKEQVTAAGEQVDVVTKERKTKETVSKETTCPEKPTTTTMDLLEMEMGEQTVDDTPLLSPAETNDDEQPSESRVTLELQAQKEKFEKELASEREATEARIRKLQDQFSEQLERLEENHHAEKAQSNAHFEQTLAHWQAQVKDRELLLESQSQEADAIQKKSSIDTERLKVQLQQAQELLADKQKEDRKLQEKHLQQLRDMEKQCNKKEDASNSLGQQIQELEKQLEESKKETESTIEDYNKLKERAKSVAVELKERRAECRTLTSEIDLLKSNSTSLQERIAQLEAKGMDMNQSSEETQEKLSSLQANLEETKRELAESQAAVEEEKTKGEEALAAYKKKAQSSLALANARSASAVQAREEAEMEARAARRTADSSMQRAMDSEMKGKQALMEAKAYVDEMKAEVAKYEDVKSQLESVREELAVKREEAASHKESNEQLQCELTSLSGRLEVEQQATESTKQSLSDEQNRSNELYDEVERLRREGQRYQEEIRKLAEARENEAPSPDEALVRGGNAEADATIAMLQEELQGANQAIKDLKETLRATIEEHETSLASSSRGMNGGFSSNGNHHNAPPENGMPLFYAMEKQAELSQARDEIARLANLLGDAESTKQEALEHMFDMKRRMEEAESRLKREEELKQSPEGKSVNLEYLKNIMLSYLNAGTVQEKKALLPVIGTVLCLTHDEQSMALEQLDKGNGSMMNSVTSSVLNLRWS